MVGSKKGGLLAPIHVQKHLVKQKISCSDNDCLSVFFAARNENPSMQCQHLDAVPYSLLADTHPLTSKSLEEMCRKNVIGDQTRIKLFEACENCRTLKTPFVVYCDFSCLGYKDRFRYYSVYTGELHYYCRLKRIRVTLDSDIGSWSCLCPDSSKICFHQAAAMWYVMENQPHLMHVVIR